NPPNGCTVNDCVVVPFRQLWLAPSRGSKQPMLPGAVSVSVLLKLPKVVKAAVLPVLLRASRLSGARPPPVTGLSEANSKLVGGERAARVPFEAQGDPPGQFGPRSPLLLTASAEFR